MAFDTLTLKAAADIDMSALDDAKDAVDDFADHFESELEDIDDRIQTNVTVDDVDTSAVETAFDRIDDEIRLAASVENVDTSSIDEIDDEIPLDAAVDDVDTSAVENALRDRYTLQANILPPTVPEIPDAMLGVDKLHFQNQVDDLEPQFVETYLDVEGILREGFSADTNPNTNAGFRGPDGSFAGAEDAVRDTQLRDFIAEMGEDSLLMGLLGRGNGIPLGDGGSAGDGDTSDLESILPPGMSLAGGGGGSEASPDHIVSLLEQLTHQSGRPANKTLPGTVEGMTFDEAFMEGESVADGQIPMRLLDDLVDSDGIRSDIEQLQRILADERDFTGEQLQQIIEDDNLSTGQKGLLRNLVFDAPFGEGESFEQDTLRDRRAMNMGRLFGGDDEPLSPATGLLMDNAFSRRVFTDKSRRKIERRLLPSFSLSGGISSFIDRNKLDDDEFDGFFDIMRQVNFSMRDYLQIVTDLLPVFGVFIAAIPAAVASLISLAAAATAVIGAFGAIAGLGLMGFIMQDDGTLDFQILKDELRETAEAFVDAFAPLARRFAPLIADFFERTRAIFDDLARAAGPLTQFTDEFRDVFDILESALPALLSGAIQLAQATLPLVIESLSFIAEIDFFELFGEVIAATLPIMAILFRRIIAMLPALIKLSLGFLKVATAVVAAVVGVLNFLDAFGPLLPIFGTAIALILTTVTVLSLLQTALTILGPIATAVATGISTLGTVLTAFSLDAVGAAIATFSLTSALYALAFIVTGGLIAAAFVTLQQQISSFRNEVSGLTDDLSDLDSVSSNMSGFGGGLGVGGAGTGGRGSIYVDNSQTVVNGSGRASILSDRTDFGSETSVYSDGRYHNT